MEGGSTVRPDERRKQIIERLSFRRHDTIQHFANEFGVSWLTIHRDIQHLEEEYPLVITRGNGGGVALPDGYYITKTRLTQKQAGVLRRAIHTVCESDCEILESILFTFVR